MLKNTSQKTTISENAQLVTSLWGKARGLMFTLKQKNSLIFVNRREEFVPLHMFFVFYPIDVLYVNSDKQVVEIKERFLPFTIYHPKNKAQYVIEVPAGSVAQSKTQVGDQLHFCI